MFEDYKKELLEFYFHKKAIGQLSSNLENPGRLKLKSECLKVFLMGNTSKDENIVKVFFDPLNRYDDQLKSIEKFELDKFRPLVSFLKNSTNIRDEESVKLIAWLLGYTSYRDWRLKKEVRSEENDNSYITNNDEKKLNGSIQEDEGLKNKSGNMTKFIVITCITVLLTGCCIYFLRDNIINGKVRQPLANEKCMYWTGHYFEPIICSEKINGAVVVPLNISTLNQLRKINSPDTLTKNSLGVIWYARIGGKHEFFTDSGKHPVDTLKRLRPLTRYILANHVSYHRYLLHFLGYSSCIVILTGLWLGSIFYFGRRRWLNK